MKLTWVVAPVLLDQFYQLLLNEFRKLCYASDTPKVWNFHDDETRLILCGGMIRLYSHFQRKGGKEGCRVDGLVTDE